MENPIHDKTLSLSTCPCGSGNSYSFCCKPVLKNHENAVTPLMLMRSRYTAFVLGNTSHLLRTWDDTFKPSSMTLDKTCKWLRLEIIESPAVTENDTSGYVHFKAFFILEKTLVELSEKSRFIRKNGKWYYQEGKTNTLETIISLNSPCPCASERKFKRCCMQTAKKS